MILYVNEMKYDSQCKSQFMTPLFFFAVRHNFLLLTLFLSKFGKLEFRNSWKLRMLKSFWSTWTFGNWQTRKSLKMSSPCRKKSQNWLNWILQGPLQKHFFDRKAPEKWSQQTWETAGPPCTCYVSPTMSKLAWKLHFPKWQWLLKKIFPSKLKTILAEKWSEIKKNVNFPWSKRLAKCGPV